MTITKTYPFSDSAEYTYSTSSMVIANGAVSLVDQDLAGLEFLEDFSNPSSFTLASCYSVVSGDSLYQRDHRPEDAMFFVPFTNSADAAWGNGGNLAATLEGSPLPVIEDGYVKFNGTLGQNLDYSADQNADSQQTGCVRETLVPGYAGSPAGAQVFFQVTKADSDAANLILLYHAADGALTLQIRDENEVLDSTVLKVWSPTSGTAYEFEVNWDLTAGQTRVFVDGTQVGSTVTYAATRNADIGLVRIGGGLQSDLRPLFWVSDFLYFSTVQHTSDYIPASIDAVAEVAFYGDAVTYPAVTYSFGVSSLQEITAITAVETNTARYTVNGLYYHASSEWVASNNTFDMANSLPVINSNIATLPVSDSITLATMYRTSSVQVIVSSVAIEYTGRVYDRSIPTIKPATALTVQQIETFSGTQVTTGDNAIGYTIEVDGVENYWTADSSWLTSNNSYNQTTTLANLVDNVASLDADKKDVRWVAYLQTNSGFNTPTISNLIVGYDFYGGDPVAPNKCIVYGHIYDPQGALVESAEIIASFTNPASLHTYDDNIIDTEQVVSYSDSGGYWEMALVENETMLPSSSSYDFRFNIPKFNPYVTLKKTVPNTVSILFKDL